MGQSADQVRRGEPIRLREGESVVIRPDEPGVARGHAVGADDRPVAQPVTTVTGQGYAPPGGGTGTQHSDDPEAIEAGIEQTRAEMSETIDAIQQRLSPENLKEEAKETASELAEHAKQAAREAVQHAADEARMHILGARDAVRDATIGRVEQMVRTVGDTTEDTRSGIMETIKQNPIPAALAGIGLAWLFMNRQSAPPRRSYLDDRTYGQSRVSRDRGYDRGDQYRSYRDEGDRYSTSYRTYGTPPTYGASYDQGRDEGGVIDRTKEKVGQVADQAGSMAGQAGDTVGRMAGQVGETASTLATQAQETAGNLAQQAQYRARRVEDQVSRSMHENPLAVGAVALALGTAVGLAVPQTRKENELFGPARDTLIERAQGMAQDTMEKVQEVATEAGHTVQREAKAAGLAQ